MTEQELYNEYQKSDCKSFTDFLINKIGELKEKLGDVQMQKAGEKSDLVWKLMTANEQKANQLTNAKEIINEFLSYYHSNNYPYQMLEILGKAEQFLSDIKEG